MGTVMITIVAIAFLTAILTAAHEGDYTEE